jgi:hypothetical protein
MNTTTANVGSINFSQLIREAEAELLSEQKTGCSSCTSCAGKRQRREGNHQCATRPATPLAGSKSDRVSHAESD